jgi:hypothetical protein
MTRMHTIGAALLLLLLLQGQQCCSPSMLRYVYPASAKPSSTILSAAVRITVSLTAGQTVQSSRKQGHSWLSVCMLFGTHKSHLYKHQMTLPAAAAICMHTRIQI